MLLGFDAVTVVGLMRVVVTTEGRFRGVFVANPTKTDAVPSGDVSIPNRLKRECYGCRVQNMEGRTCNNYAEKESQLWQSPGLRQ